MFRHVVQMSWSRDLSDDELASVVRAFDDLGSQCPDVVSISHGPDARVREGGASYALVADFEHADAWRSYCAHPAHEVVRDLLRDIVANQSIVQYWMTDSNTD